MNEYTAWQYGRVCRPAPAESGFPQACTKYGDCMYTVAKCKDCGADAFGCQLHEEVVSCCWCGSYHAIDCRHG